MNHRNTVVSLHFAVVLLGMTGLFAKFLPLNPLTIIHGRSIFTVLFILALAWVMKAALKPKSARNALLMLTSGVILIAHWYFFFLSIQLSTVAVGVVGFSTFPVFVTLLEPLFFRERYRGLDALSAALVCVGIIIVAPELTLSNDITLAMLAAVFSGLLLALYSLLNRYLIAEQHYLSITLMQHAVACVFTLPWVVAMAAWPRAEQWLLLALLGVVFTGLPQILLVRGLRQVKAQFASVVVGLEPVYSIMFAFILLHEVPRWTTLVGGLVIAAGVFVASTVHRPPPTAS